MNSTLMNSAAPTEESPAAITAKSQSNFALSFLFLPRNQRQGITNFYAFSRVVDDAVDDYGPEEGARYLQFWKEEVTRCYDGTPTHPVTQALKQTIQEFQIPRRYLDLLVEGCEWDLTQNRYETYEALYQYCYRVAGCIGLVCMKIFGLEGEEAEKTAEELGIALQLTNILRDVAEDAKRNRIYIPQEDLHRYRLSEAELVEGKMGPKLHCLFKLMAERAETLYHRAFTKMKRLPRRPLIAAWIMGEVYFRILQKIKKNNYDVFSRKISLSKPTKTLLALRTWGRCILRS